MLSSIYYKALAKAIKESNNRERIIEKLCNVFKEENLNFDIERFKKACEDLQKSA